MNISVAKPIFKFMSKYRLRNQKDIKEAIVEAIAFFDLFSLPLTSFELWQSLEARVSYGRVLDILDKDRPEAVEREGPFYFLKGREHMADRAGRQLRFSRRKTKIAEKAARILRFVNGVEMVAVCNNFYYRDESDVDVFLMIKRGRMWTSRLLATLFIHLRGIRRHGQKVKDRICLSFYAVSDKSGLKEIALAGGDPYLEFWAKHLRQLYDKGSYAEFLKNNPWLKERFPNAGRQSPPFSRIVKDNFFSKAFKRANSWWFDTFLGDALESFFRWAQLKKMSANKNSLASEPDTRVLISDGILKFHENDRRKELKQKLKEKKKEWELTRSQPNESLEKDN